MANLSNINNKFLVTTGGNVGINATSPTSKIDVREDANNVYTGYFYNSSTAANAHGINVQTATTNAGAYAFRVNSGSNTNALVVKGDANVGIGTDSPDAKLEINANSATLTQEILKVKGGGSGGAYGFLVEANNGDDLFKVDTLSYNSYFTNGNVGIGTASPDALLHLSGASPYIYIDDTSTTGTRNRFQLIVGDVGTTQSGIFGFNNTSGSSLLDVLTLNESGNVGIGTVSPGSTLTLGNATGNVAELRVLRSNSLSTTYGFINTVGGTAQLGGSSDTRVIASTGRLLFNSNSTDQISLEANGEYRLKLGSTTTGYEASMSNNNTAYQIFGSRFGGTGKYVAIWSDGANENTRFYPTKTVFYKDVGINKIDPAYKLHVRGGSATEETVLKIDKTATADSGGHMAILGLGTESGAWAKGGIGFERTGAYDTGKMHFLMYPTGNNTNTVGLSNSVMTINNDGNVGIGTASPQSNLDIKGSGNTAINSKGNLFVSSGGTAAQAAETGGQISFGSWLNGDLSQPYPLAAIRGVAESSTTNNNRGALIFGTMDSNTAVQERMRIDSSGNVGINAAASFRFNGAADNTHAVGYDSTIDGSFLRGQLGMRFLTGTGGGSERMRITSGGDIQIPTNSASLQLRSSGSTAYTSIRRDAANQLIVANTAGNQVFGIGNGGELAITNGASYSVTHTYSNAWNSGYQTLILGSQLSPNSVYIITINVGGGFGTPPYYASAVFTIVTAPSTNSTGGGFDNIAPTATHVNSNVHWKYRLSCIGTGRNGVEAWLVNGPTNPPANPSINVKATKIMTM